MPTDYASRMAQQLAQIKPVRSKTATFVGFEGSLAVVNTGETTIRVPFTGQTLPPPGYAVQLEVRDGQVTVTGSAVPLPDTGVILATGEYLATVDANGIDYELPYQSAYLPIVGDQVEITWTRDTGVIQGKVTAFPVATAPPVAAPVTGGSFHPAPFTAVDSGSYGSRWFTGDVYASDSNTGAFFYGSKVRDSIPDNAAITGARIYLNPRQSSGAAPILRAHTSATKPGGPVTFTGAGYALPARSGWVNIPTSMVDFLKANNGGIGFEHGGYSIFRGVSSDGLSGALDISWTV
jgi:hypothetical protein